MQEAVLPCQGSSCPHFVFMAQQFVPALGTHLCISCTQRPLPCSVPQSQVQVELGLCCPWPWQGLRAGRFSWCPRNECVNKTCPNVLLSCWAGVSLARWEHGLPSLFLCPSPLQPLPVLCRNAGTGGSGQLWQHRGC